MANSPSTRPAPTPIYLTPWAALIRSPWPWLVLIAGQFLAIQLWTGLEYGDAPRNLHWGAFLTEQPAFLTGALDEYDMTKGFVPDPPTLAPKGYARPGGAPFNLRWGPLPLLLLAGVWYLTGSPVALELVVPL